MFVTCKAKKLLSSIICLVVYCREVAKIKERIATESTSWKNPVHVNDFTAVTTEEHYFDNPNKSYYKDRLNFAKSYSTLFNQAKSSTHLQIKGKILL